MADLGNEFTKKAGKELIALMDKARKKSEAIQSVYKSMVPLMDTGEEKEEALKQACEGLKLLSGNLRQAVQDAKNLKW